MKKIVFIAILALLPVVTLIDASYAVAPIDDWLQEYPATGSTFLLHFNETSGDTAYDSSGNGYDGAIEDVTGIEWMAGRYNNSLYFDGNRVNNWEDCTKVTTKLVDLSGLTGLGGSIRLFNNPNLTDVTHPATSVVITEYDINGCNVGYLDFTQFTGVNNGISINLYSNNLTAAEINCMLVDLDNSGWINGTLFRITGNAAPDGSSGGCNGTAAEANLVGKGWTIS